MNEQESKNRMAEISEILAKNTPPDIDRGALIEEYRAIQSDIGSRKGDLREGFSTGLAGGWPTDAHFRNWAMPAERVERIRSICQATKNGLARGETKEAVFAALCAEYGVEPF